MYTIYESAQELPEYKERKERVDKLVNKLNEKINSQLINFVSIISRYKDEKISPTDKSFINAVKAMNRLLYLREVINDPSTFLGYWEACYAFDSNGICKYKNKEDKYITGQNYIIWYISDIELDIIEKNMNLYSFMIDDSIDIQPISPGQLACKLVSIFDLISYKTDHGIITTNNEEENKNG